MKITSNPNDTHHAQIQVHKLVLSARRVGPSRDTQGGSIFVHVINTSTINRFPLTIRFCYFKQYKRYSASNTYICSVTMEN